MMEVGARRGSAAALVIRIVVVFDAVTLLLFALLHLGARIPVGLGVIATDRIIPATIVEGLAGTGLVVSAYAVFARRTWAWPATVAAHLFALAGVLLGVWAIAAGFGPHNLLNDTYHRLMVVVLVAGLILLWTPGARAALGRGKRTAWGQ